MAVSEYRLQEGIGADRLLGIRHAFEIGGDVSRLELAILDRAMSMAEARAGIPGGS